MSGSSSWGLCPKPYSWRRCLRQSLTGTVRRGPSRPLRVIRGSYSPEEKRLRRKREHLAGEQLHGRGVGELEGEQAEAQDDLLHTQGGKVLHLGGNLVRRSHQL